MQIKSILFGLFFSSCFMLLSATIEVENVNDDGAGSFREACFDAKSGDVITFAPALGNDEIVLLSPMGININDKELTIIGPESKITILPDNVGPRFRLFNLQQALSIKIENIVFSSGGNNQQILGEDGGAISFHGTNLTLVNCVFDGNTAYEANGGAIDFQGIALSLTDCVFDGNTSYNGNGGAIDYAGLTMDVIDCEFINNQITGDNDGDGGAFYFDGDSYTGSALLIDNTVFNNNQTVSSTAGGGYGAGVTFKGDKVTVKNSIFKSNSFNTYGDGSGGALALNVFTSMLVEHNLFEANRAMGAFGGDGGAVFAQLGASVTDAELSYCTFKQNQTYNEGEAMYVLNLSNVSLDIFNNTFGGNAPSTSVSAQSGIYLATGRFNFNHNTICDFVSTSGTSSIFLDKQTNSSVANFSNNLFSNNYFGGSPAAVFRKTGAFIVSDGGNVIDLEEDGNDYFPSFNQLDLVGKFDQAKDVGLQSYYSNLNDNIIETRGLEHDSPARDFGNSQYAIGDDANFKTRDELPDAGAVEYGQKGSAVIAGAPESPIVKCNTSEIKLVGNVPTPVGVYSGRWILPTSFNGYNDVNSGNLNDVVVLRMYGDDSFIAIWQVEDEDANFYNYEVVVDYKHFPLQASNAFWQTSEKSCNEDGYEDLYQLSDWTGVEWNSYTIDDDVSGGKEPTISNLNLSDPMYVSFEYFNLKPGINKIYFETSVGACKSVDTLIVDYKEATVHPSYLPNGKIVTAVEPVKLPDASNQPTWYYDFNNSAVGYGIYPNVTVNPSDLTSEITNLSLCKRYRFAVREKSSDLCPQYYVDVVKEYSTGEKCLTLIKQGYDTWCSGESQEFELVTTYSSPYLWSSTNSEVTFSDDESVVTDINTNGVSGGITIQISANGNTFDSTMHISLTPLLDLGLDVITQSSPVQFIVLDTFPIQSSFRLNGSDFEVEVENRLVTIANLDPKKNTIIREYNLYDEVNFGSCYGYDTLLVFYETEIDTTVSSSVVQITAESDGTKEFDVFELLQESFPDLTFENYVISDTVEISIANPDKVSITRILKTSRFVLKFDAITDISPDDYIVVKVCMDDRNACYNLRINLLSIVATELIVYNAVSPNEDGKNDYLHLGNAEFYDNIQVTIFTRQGNVVWENKESYDNDSNYWEGLGENGERLLSGTYFYIIKYSKTEDNGSESMPTLKGYLQLKFDSNGALDNN